MWTPIGISEHSITSPGKIYPFVVCSFRNVRKRAGHPAGEGERVLEVKAKGGQQGWEGRGAGQVTRRLIHHVGSHVDERHLSGWADVRWRSCLNKRTDNGMIQNFWDVVSAVLAHREHSSLSCDPIGNLVG